MEQERVRTKERETLVRPNDGGMASRNGFIDRQFRGRLLVRGRDIPVPPAGQTRQADTSMYLNPDYDKDTVFQDWLVFINNIRVHSGKHIHQGGLCLFILDGKGYTVIEGVREDWSPGDLLLLPIVPGGVEHQHFDAEPPNGARWLAYLYLPWFEHVASGLRQVETSYTYQKKTGTTAVTEGGHALDNVYNPNRDFSGWPRDSFGDAPRANGGFNGYAALMKRRGEERKRLPGLDTIIRGDSLPWETNPQGIMQWYMHPDLPDRVLRNFLFYRQEIPGESRSGRQRHQGGVIFFFTEGRGHTIIDGERFDWEKDDLLQLPLRPDGAEFQHFNDSRGPARFTACEPNDIDALGIDRGSGLLQLENCPEYDRGQ